VESPLLRDNILSRIPARESRAIPLRAWKEVGFDFLTILTALWVSFAYRGYLLGTTGLTQFFIATGLFSMCALLGAIFTKNFTHRFVLSLAASFALVSFLPGDAKTHIAGALASFSFFLAGEFTARKELENASHVKFFAVARGYLKKLTTALVLIVIIFLPKFDAETGTPILTERFFGGVFDASIKVASGLYPEVKFDDSLEDFLRTDVELKIQNDIRFRDLLPNERLLVVGEAVRTSIADWQQFVGKAIDPSRPLKDFIFELISKGMNDLALKAKEWIAIAWVVALFMAFRGIGTIFYFLIAFISFGVYQFLIAFKFAKISFIQRPHETIELT